ncbi:MAG: glutathione S-transferase family protein, partial [Alphaproteobacteria bacterium]
MFESRRPDIRASEQPAGPLLVVGDLRTDAPSLVALLALTSAGTAPVLEVVPTTGAERAARLAAVSPTSRLPVLVEHGTTIWETLAILEWAAERAPRLWPAHARRRAVARAVVAEALGGFPGLSQQLPGDWFARYRLRDEPPAAVQVDLHRLARLWSELLEDGDGFLFGPRAGLADLAMVPLAARLRTYDRWPREPAGRAYAERLLALDEVVAAFAGAIFILFFTPGPG